MKASGFERVSGFTLIELMIAVAIVGILAAIAYPSYQDHLRSSRRTDAMVALSQAAQIMERHYTENMTYVGAPIAAASPEGFYTVGFAQGSPTANTFVVQAAPVQNGPQDGDACGTFTLNQLGAPGVSGNLGAAACWN